MAKAKATQKVTHIGFHFRVWFDAKKQEVVIDTHLFDTKDVVKTHWINVTEICLSESDFTSDTGEDRGVYVISGSFNYDWFGETNYKVVDDMFSEAIRDYFFDTWEKKQFVRDYLLELWIERKVFWVK